MAIQLGNKKIWQKTYNIIWIYLGKQEKICARL